MPDHPLEMVRIDAFSIVETIPRSGPMEMHFP